MNGNGDVCAIIKVVSGPAKLPIPFVIMKAVSPLAVIISAHSCTFFQKPLLMHCRKESTNTDILLVCGPSGLLDFVLRALQALRPCDRHTVVRNTDRIFGEILLAKQREMGVKNVTKQRTDKAFLGEG